MNKVFITTIVIIFTGYLYLKKTANGNVCFIREKVEVIVCYSKCKDFFSPLFFCLKPNSKGYFEKIKKNLIQYIPTVNK